MKKQDQKRRKAAAFFIGDQKKEKSIDMKVYHDEYGF
jgi:hypothetical protein